MTADGEFANYCKSVNSNEMQNFLQAQNGRPEGSMLNLYGSFGCDVRERMLFKLNLDVLKSSCHISVGTLVVLYEAQFQGSVGASAASLIPLIDRALIPESGIRAHFWLSGSM